MFCSRALRMGLAFLSLVAITLLPATPISAQNAGETAVATEQVFVRSAPSTNDPILGELHTGDTVEIHGETSNGFISIYHGEYIGWVFMDYLWFLDSGTDAPTNDPTPEPTEVPADPTLPAEETPVPTEIPVTPEPTAIPTEEPVTPEPTDVPDTSSGSMIVWPVAGGEWEVLQGYNGSSHQNNTDLWQYQDSLDLVRTDGSTAGETVYSPVNGTIRWFDPSTGGVSIDLGNGYAVALFHVTFDSSLQEGESVYQGQPLGFISGPGQAGYASTPHVHIAVWQTSDGGNWSRDSVPFSGDLAISGFNLPNSGASYQHTGLTFTP